MTPFALSLVLAFGAIVGPLSGGVASFLSLVLALVLVPAADLLLPRAPARESSHPAWQYPTILYLGAAHHFFLVFWGAWWISCHELSGTEMVGTTLTVGTVTGAIGITFAHELVHRRGRYERLLGELVLVFVCYGHFAIEHVWGHHRHVATPLDPASARRGQSIYGFFVQTLPGSLLGALRLRPARVTGYLAASSVLGAFFFLSLGTRAAVFFYGQSLFAILLLETINYIEHYGLARKELSPGRYEAASARHSWDSDALLSGRVLINLQRHADHHLHPLKQYPTLELLEGAPRLPTGYAGMFWLAIFPPLWRRVMDRKIVS